MELGLKKGGGIHRLLFHIAIIAASYKILLGIWSAFGSRHNMVKSCLIEGYSGFAIKALAAISFVNVFPCRFLL